MKIKAKQVKNFLKNIPQVVAEKSFLFSIIFIFIAIAVGWAFFYKYDILVEKQEPQASQASLKLQEEAYSIISAEWQSRQEKFAAADFKNWPDPFFILSLTKPEK
jgi:hypothetical protein